MVILDGTHDCLCRGIPLRLRMVIVRLLIERFPDLVIALPDHVLNSDTFNDFIEILLAHLFDDLVDGSSPPLSSSSSHFLSHDGLWVIGRMAGHHLEGLVPLDLLRLDAGPQLWGHMPLGDNR